MSPDLFLSFHQVDQSVASERARLDSEQRIQLESMRSKHGAEIARLQEEAQRRHKERQDGLRSELEDAHKEVGMENIPLCFPRRPQVLIKTLIRRGFLFAVDDI